MRLVCYFELGTFLNPARHKALSCTPPIRASAPPTLRLRVARLFQSPYPRNPLHAMGIQHSGFPSPSTIEARAFKPPLALKAKSPSSLGRCETLDSFIFGQFFVLRNSYTNEMVHRVRRHESHHVRGENLVRYATPCKRVGQNNNRPISI